MNDSTNRFYRPVSCHKCLISVSREVKQLIDSMLNVDPTKRITAAGALHHPWVSNREKVAQAVHRQVRKISENFSKIQKKF